MCISLATDDLKGYSGEMFRVYVRATPFLKPGDLNIEIRDIVLTHNEWSEEDQMKHASSYEPIDPCGGVIHGATAECNDVPLNISSVNKWSTCILPFSAELPEGVKAYSSDRKDQNYIYLTEAKSIEAYTPYILYSENGCDAKLNGVVNVENYPEDGVAKVGYLRGAVVDQVITDGYVLQNLGEGVKIYFTTYKEFQIPAGKCWIKGKYSDARSLEFAFDDESTPIREVWNPSKNPGTDQVYDLNGKAIAQPKVGQIYIKNNRMVLKVK